MANSKATTLTKLVEDEYKNISGLVIFKGDDVAYEAYFNDYDKDSAIHVASVTKSVLSALIGIAIDKGHIKSVEQKVLDFFPQYNTKRGEKTIQEVTIHHLLTMTAPYKYKSEPYTKVYSSDDWTKSVLDLLGGKSGVGEFKYTTIGIQVLSGIIMSVTGKPVLDFAKEYLFEPLEINLLQNIRIRNKDEHFAFLKEDVVSGWVADPKGANTAGWGLTLTTTDMAKIGQLYLNKGLWKNKQILTSKWVEDSTRVHSHWAKLAYGYLWWIVDDSNNTYAALGDGGNVIYVSPKKGMVIAITSQFMPRAKDRIELIEKYIEPNF